jgi:hypothetical protein
MMGFYRAICGDHEVLVSARGISKAIDSLMGTLIRAGNPWHEVKCIWFETRHQNGQVLCKDRIYTIRKLKEEEVKKL